MKKEYDRVISKKLGAISDHSMVEEDYLKTLIMLVTAGTIVVSNSASRLQFFIIRGGAEGFLPDEYSGRDATRINSGATVTTSGAAGTAMIFDDADLLVVFDKTGKLVSSARLSRPISITHPDKMTEATANLVYEAWDGQPVNLYHNTNYTVHYYGLWVDDKLGRYRLPASDPKSVKIDMHKSEATNGCIFIIDELTPDMSHLRVLNLYEPQLIQDVQHAIGAREKNNVGTMRMISIK